MKAVASDLVRSLSIEMKSPLREFFISFSFAEKRCYTFITFGNGRETQAASEKRIITQWKVFVTKDIGELDRENVYSFQGHE